MKKDRRSAGDALSRRRSVHTAARARSTTHHHAERPKSDRSPSATHAPTLPPRLRISLTATLWDHPGSARLNGPRTSDRYTAGATRMNSRDSRSSAATLLGRGAWFRFKGAPMGSSHRRRVQIAALPDPPIAPSVDRQDGLVEENRTGTNFDVPPGLEILHHPAHHLARGADHLGNVLLGKFPGHHLLAVDCFRHIKEQVRHSPVDIHEGQAPDLLVRFAKALDQPPHDRHGHLEVFGEASLEIAL